jgi:hypothetical protein
VTPEGGGLLDHVEPPSFDTMIEATLPPSSPTATQVVELAEVFGAHETARTFTAGE